MLVLKDVDYLQVNLNSLVADYDRHTLANLYQPIIGYKAVALYFTLLTEVDNQKINTIISHKNIFDRMQINAGDFVDSRKFLEAVGLLKTYVTDLKGNKLYTYELYAPKTPKLFFDNTLLYGMLIKNLGEAEANKLKNVYLLNSTPEGKEITASFIEVFSPDLDDPAFRKAMLSSGTIAGRSSAKLNSGFSYELFFKTLEEISQISAEAFSKKTMKEIERLATLYGVSEESAAQAVSEIYNPKASKDERIDFEALKQIFEDESKYHFLRKRSATGYVSGKVSSQTDLASKINLMETYAPKDYLKVLQNGTEPAVSDVRIIEELSRKYHLPNCVINAIIDYVLTKNDNILNKAFADKVAASIVREGITTTVDAMNYLKKVSSKGRRSKKPKEETDVVTTTNPTVKETEEEIPDWDQMIKDLEEGYDNGEN